MLTGEHGIVADVRLPPAEEQAAHDLLHLDFALGCPGESRSCHPSSGHDFLTCQAMQSAVAAGLTPWESAGFIAAPGQIVCRNEAEEDTWASFSVLINQVVAEVAAK